MRSLNHDNNNNTTNTNNNDDDDGNDDDDDDDNRVQAFATNVFADSPSWFSALDRSDIIAYGRTANRTMVRVFE